MQDPIVMKKTMITDIFFFKCHTKFRFAEREAQCILDECGPLIIQSRKSLRKICVYVNACNNLYYKMKSIFAYKCNNFLSLIVITLLVTSNFNNGKIVPYQSLRVFSYLQQSFCI